MTHCRRLEYQLRLVPLLDDVTPAAKALNYGLRMEAGFRKASDEDIVARDNDVPLLAIRVKPCLAAVDAATGKLPPSVRVVTYSKHGKPTGYVTLAQAKQRICTPLQRKFDQLHATVAGAKKRILERKLRPFRKVLRGGKMKTFERYGMVDLYVYTRGKRRLTSPRDFKRASVWFQEMLRDSSCPVAQCWTLRRFQFRGNRLVRTTSTSGRGSSAPRRHYR